MLHYSNGDVNILNHDISRAVAALTDYGRNLIYENVSGDWIDISRSMLEYSAALTSPHKALLDTIGIDNAVQLAVVVLQAENILISKIMSLSNSDDFSSHDSVSEIENNEKEWGENEAYEVALLCWKKRISIKDLAIDLNISENAIREIKSSDEYLQAIEKVILTVRNYRCEGDVPTHREIYLWITEFPKKPMHATFARIMGIPESKSEKLIENILETIDYKGEENEV